MSEEQPCGGFWSEPEEAGHDQSASDGGGEGFWSEPEGTGSGGKPGSDSGGDEGFWSEPEEAAGPGGKAASDDGGDEGFWSEPEQADAAKVVEAERLAAAEAEREQLRRHRRHLKYRLVSPM